MGWKGQGKVKKHHRTLYHCGIKRIKTPVLGLIKFWLQPFSIAHSLYTILKNDKKLLIHYTWFKKIEKKNPNFIVICRYINPIWNHVRNKGNITIKVLTLKINLLFYLTNREVSSLYGLRGGGMEKLYT